MIAHLDAEIHLQNDVNAAPANDDSPVDHLSARHYHTLQAGSGILDEVIRERGYRTCTGWSELKSLGISARRDTDTHGLLIPLHTVHGKPAQTIIRDGFAPLTVYRPDTPQVDDKGKERKYLFPQGGEMRLDCPPRCQPALSNPALPLWITEGQKKADALASHGACAIALLGVWNWRGTNEEGGKVMLADWEHVALNDRAVRIVFDSDVMRKREVQRALDRLALSLRSKGARVHVAYLPDEDGAKKIGVDDYLLSHTLQDLERLLVAPGQARTAHPTHPQHAIALKLNAYGQPKAVLWNVMTVLEQDERWHGAAKRNLLSGKVELHRVPERFTSDPWIPRPVEDTDLTLIACWLQEHYELFTSSALVHEALNAIANRYPYHPVRDYLSGLQWDGTPRLDTWLIRHCHVEDTPYSRAVGSKTLISAVARVMQPGCKVDTMLILQGEQGFLKSEALRRVASDAWFKDDMPRDLGHKDAKAYLQDAWVIEFAELSQFKRSEIEEVKAFVTTRQDTFRHAYGRMDHAYPRQCIFVATTNQDIIFHDETGNRRFWPVKVNAMCDVNGIDRERDQLWAEAMVRHQAGEQWYLTGDLEKAAAAEQADRVEQDPCAGDILHYLQTANLRTTTYRGQDTVFVTVEEILEHVLELDRAHRDLYAQRRVARVLKMAHWRGGIKVEYPDAVTGKPRQLRAFIPPQQEEPLEPLGEKTSGSASDPHKTSSKPLEPLEPLEFYKESESGAEQFSGGELLQETPPPSFQGKLGFFSGSSGFNGSNLVTPTTTKTSLEPLETHPSGSSVHPSGSTPAALTDKDPCPHCGQQKMKVFKTGQLVCHKCGKKTLTTWQA